MWPKDLAPSCGQRHRERQDLQPRARPRRAGVRALPGLVPADVRRRPRCRSAHQS